MKRVILNAFILITIVIRLFVPTEVVWGPEQDRTVDGPRFAPIWKLEDTRRSINGFTPIYKLDAPRLIYELVIVSLLFAAVYLLVAEINKKQN